MPRRKLDVIRETAESPLMDADEPPKKHRRSSSSFNLSDGEILTDLSGKQWKLGNTVGVGGFGEIFLATDNVKQNASNHNTMYVAKIESHSNGPLFVEINCYLRIGKLDSIKEWRKREKIKSLGMPHYVASGSHRHNGDHYRFLILPRFKLDLHKVLSVRIKLPVEIVFRIASQMIRVLEYIHSKGYVHSDIKASNILIDQQEAEQHTETKKIKQQSGGLRRSFRQSVIKKRISRLRQIAVKNYSEELNSNFSNEREETLEIIKEPQPLFDDASLQKKQYFLLDFGLASKYQYPNGEHKPQIPDERRAHVGTLLFSSRDAHHGSQSRRSDLESLGYNMVYWLSATLPWLTETDPELVARKKQRAMNNPEKFLNECFRQPPRFLLEYFTYVQQLPFQKKPSYKFCESLFTMENQKNTPKKIRSLCKLKRKKNMENLNLSRYFFAHPVNRNSFRSPLKSHNSILIKPLLRIKAKKRAQKSGLFNWSKILVDPEDILKQNRRKQHTEHTPPESGASSGVLSLNIDQMNPTSAMLEVYNRCKMRSNSAVGCKGDSFDYIEGYTPVMMAVHKQMIERRQQLEREKFVAEPIKKKTKASKRLKQTKSAPIGNKKEKPKQIPLKRTYSLRG